MKKERKERIWSIVEECSNDQPDMSAKTTCADNTHSTESSPTRMLLVVALWLTSSLKGQWDIKRATHLDRMTLSHFLNFVLLDARNASFELGFGGIIYRDFESGFVVGILMVISIPQTGETKLTVTSNSTFFFSSALC